MTLLEEMAENGTDIKDGLKRLAGSEDIYIMLLKKLPDMVKKDEVLPFIDSGDIEKATMNAHTLKGVFGNLSVTNLYKNYTEIVNLLRAGKVPEARQLYVETVPVQEKIFEIINKY